MNRDSELVREVLLARQGQRLLQIGIALILLTSFEGFVVPYFAVPRLGLSVHTLSALIGVLTIAVGLMWARLRLSAMQVRIAFWLFIYSSFAIIVAYVLAAVWGAGNSTIAFAAGTAHGSAAQETIIRVVAYSSAPTGIISFALMLWGLRMDGSKP
jgi:hydroxylaminobenzene mutase